MARLAALMVLVIVAVSLFATTAAAKPRRYWCARAAALQQQIADTAAQRDALSEQREALEAAGRATAGAPAVVFPLYHSTPEQDYAFAQQRCTKHR
jgi:hypothetical protein